MSEPTQAAPGEKPAEKKEKKKRLKGFAGMLSNMLKPLNENARFKERFGAEVLTFVINATDFPPAAVIKVDKGTVAFEEAQPDEVKEIKGSLLQGTMDNIMKVASGKLDPIKAIFKRQIKVKGALKLLKLNKMFLYAMKAATAGPSPAPAQQPAPAAQPGPDPGKA
ncbi:MAG: SCP2 sterol-binding domain-containing protein [Candidatus Lokiarchaeota archaeon]|nr:SCP2 sterol-binding domain-containing protein [Candidatus Lokiarchaeota archaeon]